ncbi:MAG: nucleotidyl transferase AbiEii/AbiGii toxin family protein [Gammaproteobacteria bacterium]|nr:nucleotidyl transferase AbiEii/AbiGii toxin family protein [Gammaproteobacteria bacterium]TVQ45464.1 MAG: nucleotidyl transferase AbiEii/AbiGii toxin family protein [Gammaproteobacteria bacterium]
MAEYFFDLSHEDRREALEYAREQTGRPSHLLEKDVWVVWMLRALFESPLATDLTFKGGTSLSKVYKVIDRFSEDIDLTYDIRSLIPDLIGAGDQLPTSRSQASKWTKTVRQRLPSWIEGHVQPVIQTALERDGLDATIAVHDNKLLLRYPDVAQGTGYVAPVVLLEFGGRATGEPHQVLPAACDMAGHVPGVTFPAATPLVMTLARTFWEKATAAHVYCAQGRIRGDRYARHWYDLAAITRSAYFADAIADRAVASAVVNHKSRFFIEKDAKGTLIDYSAATTGRLKIVPEGEARNALAEDYAAMLADEVMLSGAPPFDTLLELCGHLETQVNKTAAEHVSDVPVPAPHSSSRSTVQ